MTTTLIVIGIILAVLLLMGLVNGKDVTVEKTVTINKPVADVYTYLKFVKNHDQFNEWAKAVPNDKKSFKGTDGELGFVYSWDSDNKSAGAGEQEIKLLEENRRIEHELRFIRPSPGVAKGVFALKPVSPGQTQVQWGFYSEMKFPMTIMKPLMKGFLSKTTEKGLQNLKAVLEQ